MTDNIDLLLKYYIKNTYSSRKNGYIAKMDGDLTKQYNLLEWDSCNPDPKPTLIQLDGIKTITYLEERRKSCITNMKRYSNSKRITQLIRYNSNDYQADKESAKVILSSISDKIDYRNWYDSNNLSHVTTKTEREEMFELCGKLSQLYKDKQEYYRTEINNSSNPESIDCTIGFPSNPFIG